MSPQDFGTQTSLACSDRYQRRFDGPVSATIEPVEQGIERCRQIGSVRVARFHDDRRARRRRELTQADSRGQTCGGVDRDEDFESTFLAREWIDETAIRLTGRCNSDASQQRLGFAQLDPEAFDELTTIRDERAHGHPGGCTHTLLHPGSIKVRGSAHEDQRFVECALFVGVAAIEFFRELGQEHFRFRAFHGENTGDIRERQAHFPQCADQAASRNLVAEVIAVTIGCIDTGRRQQTLLVVQTQSLR